MNNEVVAGWLVVLVDNKEYVPISPLKDTASGEVNLTTMLPDQDRAIIQLYFRGPKYLQEIHSFALSDLPTGEHRPRIVVSAHVRAKVHVTLRVDGEVREERSFTVPSAVHARRWFPLVAIGVLILLLGFLVAALSFGLIAPRTTVEPPQSVSTTGAEDRITELMAEARERATSISLETPADSGDGEPPENATVDTNDDGQVEPDRPPPAEQQANDGTNGTADLLFALTPATILFEPESAVLLPEARQSIREIAESLSTAERLSSISVVGHTALFGNAEARLALSRERAAAVAEELDTQLRRLGVTGDIETEGVGGTQPLTQREDEQWRNRRVEVSAR